MLKLTRYMICSGVRKAYEPSRYLETAGISHMILLSVLLTAGRMSRLTRMAVPLQPMAGVQ